MTFRIERPANKPRFTDPAPADTARGTRTRPSDQPDIQNVQPLFEMGSHTFIAVGNRPVKFAPTPYREGWALARARQRMDAMLDRCKAEDRMPTDAELDAYEEDVRSVVAIITALAVPVGMVGRIKKRLGLWRPFKHASEGEIGVLLSFLLKYRTRSRIRTSMGR